MIWYSCIFNLTDSKDYLYMLMILVSSMLRTKSLQEKDTYYLVCDPETASLVKTSPLLKRLTLIEREKPKSVLEGCKWRYELHKHADVFDKTCCYLDVDMICIKTTHLAELQENQMIVYPEGKSTDSNYCGDMFLKCPVGFTSAFFAYKVGFDVLAILEDISYKIEQGHERVYYTLDQPYFNKALEDKTNLLTFPNHLLSFNGHTNMPEAHFINCCGEPGNGAFHFVKMLNMIL